ncbi:hypothetical protein Trydic_g18202 [Trypoxylus dichotomus]
MEDAKRSRPLDITYSARKTLWLLGFHNSEEMKKHTFYRMNGIIVASVIILLPVLSLTEMVIGEDVVYMEVLHYLLTQVWVVIKLLLYLSYRSKLLILEDFLRCESLNVHSYEQDHFISTAIRIQKIFIGSLGVIGWMFTLIFGILPLLTEKSLLVPIWMPIKFETEFWHAYETVYYFILVCIYVSIDSLVLGFVAIATAELEILRNNLENVVVRQESDSYAVQEENIRKRLIGCVIHHNSIIT